MLTFLEVFAITTLHFSAPPSTGNLSLVRNDTLFLRSAANVSGWVISAKQNLRNKRLRAKIVNSGWDGSFSISPRVDLSATTGVFAQPSRLRFCPYGLPRTLHVEWRRDGVTTDFSVGPAGSDPFWIAMSFERDSVRFERSSDGKVWQVLWREKFNLPGYSLADSFYVELQAHKTPTGGEMIATQVGLEDLAPPPPIIPVQVPSTEVTIEWEKNQETDLAGYVLYYGAASRKYNRMVLTGMRRAVTVQNLQPHTQYFFAVTAYDTSGNESPLSSEVSARTGAAAQEFSEYDLNLTGMVDEFDWLLLLRLLGYEAGHERFNPRADVTGDGRIDGFDKAKFARLSGVF